MGRSQRIKGRGYEQEVVNVLKAAGIEAKRNLSQTREGGGDIDLGTFMLECKRRKSIAVYDWLDQCTAACVPGQTPIVVARGDQRESVVVMKLTDWLEMVKKR